MIRWKRRSRRIRGLLFSAALAMILTVFSAFPAIHARYGTHDSGNAGARVARYQVSAGPASLKSADDLAEDPEDRIVYTVLLKNDSECGVVYELKLVNATGKELECGLSDQGGELGIGEEKNVEVSVKVPESVFRSLTSDTKVEGLRIEAVFSQTEPGGAS